jgi:hypothetical protein
MQQVAAKKAIVLSRNFDRLSVLSVRAEVSVDEGGSSNEEGEEEGEEGDSRGERGEREGEAARRLKAKPTIGPRRGGSNRRPGYAEAAGDARLAWRWVEGWRARLRKGGDVVEKARWEWRLDRTRSMGVPSTVPVVVVGEPEGVGVSQG